MPHIHEQIDFTVSAFIVHKNKVLLRMHDKYKIWLGPGGHIELDEDPNEAVVREVKEEVGLDVELFKGPNHPSSPDIYDETHHKELIPPQFLNRHHTSPSHEHIDLVYFATAKSNLVKQGETEVSDNIHWFTKEDLTDPQYTINEDIRHYAQKALELLSS